MIQSFSGLSPEVQGVVIAFILLFITILFSLFALAIGDYAKTLGAYRENRKLSICLFILGFSLLLLPLAGWIRYCRVFLAS